MTPASNKNWTYHIWCLPHPHPHPRQTRNSTFRCKIIIKTCIIHTYIGTDTCKMLGEEGKKIIYRWGGGENCSYFMFCISKFIVIYCDNLEFSPLISLYFYVYCTGYWGHWAIEGHAPFAVIWHKHALSRLESHRCLFCDSGPSQWTALLSLTPSCTQIPQA